MAKTVHRKIGLDYYDIWPELTLKDLNTVLQDTVSNVHKHSNKQQQK
jgi:hypothetical protein